MTILSLQTYHFQGIKCNLPLLCFSGSAQGYFGSNNKKKYKKWRHIWDTLAEMPEPKQSLNMPTQRKALNVIPQDFTAGLKQSQVAQSA